MMDREVTEAQAALEAAGQEPCPKCQGTGKGPFPFRGGYGKRGACRGCNGYGTADPATWDNY